MKERPILFSGAMVRAILNGRKTQTRRLEGFAAINANPDDFQFLKVGDFQGAPHAFFHQISTGTQVLVKLKKGQPGDRLWVKETFCNAALDGYPHVYLYRADEDTKPDGVNWKPSIFCTRKASRITLEITAVRVERLQDITIDDAIAEGCDNCSADYPNSTKPAVTAYHTLWESINGPGSWAKNPWVWVIEFKRLTP